MLMRERVFNGVSAVGALLLWGSWTYWINSTAPTEARWLSSIAQGVASFIITLIMATLVTFFYRKLRHNLARCWLPPLLTCALTSMGLYVVHTLVGTMYILPTIAPAIAVGLLFCFVANRRLYLQEGNNSVS